MSPTGCHDRGFACSCVAVFLALALTLPVGSALQIGGDEPFELTKAFLCYLGYTLYNEIWNDQPPAHTLLLAGLFYLTGPSPLAARLLAVGFGALLVGLLAGWLRRQTGPLAAAAGVGVFLASPMALNLSVSAMLEVPAFAVGLVAAWLLERRDRLFDPVWLIASAATLAVALQIKLTAGLLVPAVLVLLLFPTSGHCFNACALSGPRAGPCGRADSESGWLGPGRLRLAESGPALALWLAALAAAFAMLSWILGTGGYDLLWAAHHSPAMNALLDDAQEYRFTLAEFEEFPEGTAGALVGIALSMWLGGWRRTVFPTVWLATVLVVHVQHRPWWAYYFLHLDVPMAWLFALAIHSAQMLWRDAPSANRHRSVWSQRAGLLILVLLLSLGTVYGGERFIREFMSIQSGERVQDSLLVQELRRHAPRARWMFTRHTIYTFHAQVPVPPPLAVLPAKRFWSGRLSEADLLREVQAWRPEILLLGEDEFSAGWGPWLESSYALVAQAQDLSLYVHKDIADLRQTPTRAPADFDPKTRLGL